MNVMSVGKPSVGVLVLLITEESTTYRGSTTVGSVGRPSVRVQVSSSTRESTEEKPCKPRQCWKSYSQHSFHREHQRSHTGSGLTSAVREGQGSFQHRKLTLHQRNHSVSKSV